ncbi:MAG: hypothetical protein IPP32_18080 [Bacteroidetes bacterium]|nr:hypothetical protein [Bacteroidota bacterium]
MPGLKNLSSAQFYDFETAPQLPLYTFENEVVELHPHGSFTQIPISVIHIPKAHQLANKFLLKYLWKTGNRSIGDGNGVVATSNDESNPRMLPQGEMVSLELLNSIKLPLYYKYLKSSKIMHFISHPKMLSKHNLKKLEQFLINARQQYVLECDFRKMQE